MIDTAGSGPARTRGVLVICTKDRPREIELSLSAAHRTAPDMPILVIDASADEATREVCEILRREHQRITLTHRRAARPGLARQRNEAIGLCRQLGTAIVHFIDDDTEVLPGYFQAVEERFAAEPAVMGLGGAILNQPRVNYVAAKRLFLLGSRRPSAVLRSGRNILGQYPSAVPDARVDWLNGCSMSFRIQAFDRLQFDESRRGYSLGEDYDLTFRLSRKYLIGVEPAARCIHHMSPTLRYSTRSQARAATLATHEWVANHRALGMSIGAFWWSAIGDLTLRLGHGVLTCDRRSLQGAAGVLEGVISVLRAEISRSAPVAGREAVP